MLAYREYLPCIAVSDTSITQERPSLPCSFGNRHAFTPRKATSNRTKQSSYISCRLKQGVAQESIQGPIRNRTRNSVTKYT